jgi:hypothetical protein
MLSHVATTRKFVEFERQQVIVGVLAIHIPAVEVLSE